ncbi:unnamed protein product [Allacma fusca]|uniref:Uncharacterized protein n=1 Tax=Allacma fusca TaxID=39272 RepID=A0A8J2KX85_9HEXA|nr:unnamed protein product [Allacma fusca]
MPKHFSTERLQTKIKAGRTMKAIEQVKITGTLPDENTRLLLKSYQHASKCFFLPWIWDESRKQMKARSGRKKSIFQIMAVIQAFHAFFLAFSLTVNIWNATRALEEIMASLIPTASSSMLALFTLGNILYCHESAFLSTAFYSFSNSNQELQNHRKSKPKTLKLLLVGQYLPVLLGIIQILKILKNPNMLGSLTMLLSKELKMLTIPLAVMDGWLYFQRVNVAVTTISTMVLFELEISVVLEAITKFEGTRNPSRIFETYRKLQILTRSFNNVHRHVVFAKCVLLTVTAFELHGSAGKLCAYSQVVICELRALQLDAYHRKMSHSLLPLRIEVGSWYCINKVVLFSYLMSW